MKIDELVPNTDEMMVSKKVLRDCDFHLEGKKITAFCGNAAEASYLELIFKEPLLRAAQEKKGKAFTLEIVRSYTFPSVAAAAEQKGALQGTAQLNYAYTFDTFIAGQSNKSALTAAMNMVSAKPYQSTSANFLYIYGSIGSGKTHLLHSALHALLERGKHIAFFNSSEFADYVLKGMHKGGEEYIEQMHLFRDVNVLAIDDMSFLRRMPRVQEELKGILDHLISSGKMGLFTGEELPTDERFNLIPEVSSRLITGMTAKIEPPDKNLLRDILESQFAQRRILLQPEAFDYLAEVNITSIRSILSVANAVANAMTLDGQPMTLDKARAILHNLKVTTPSTSEQLISRLMEKMNVIVPMQELQQTRASKEVRVMRDNIIMELLKNGNIRQADIARAFKLKPQYISKAVARHNK